MQDVKFSANGDHFASVGSDAKVFLYDGKTGETIGELSGEVHKGSIVGDYSPFLNCMADSLVRWQRIGARMTRLW